MKYSDEIVAAAALLIEEMPGYGCFFSMTDGTMTLPQDLIALACALPKKEKEAGAGPQALMDLWNELADERLPRCAKLTDKRRHAARARLKEFPKKEQWERLIDAINHNPWALGETPNPGYQNWKADFDYLIKPMTMVRFIEKGMERRASAPSDPREGYSERLERR